MSPFLRLPSTLGLTALVAFPLLVPGQEPELLPDQLPGTPPPTHSWEELIERESKVGFIQTRTGDRALADLELPELADEHRMAALMALGCGEHPRTSERPRLESWAVEGPPSVRIAAILGLGEMGLPDPGMLLRFADEPDPYIAEAALVALLRSDSPAGLARVQEIARDEQHPHSQAATSLLVFYLDRTALLREELDARTTRAARALLELRFAAARRYGLFDNQVWSVLVLEDLVRDQSFLDRVVYRAAPRVHRPGVRDHFLEVLIEGQIAGEDGSYEALRGAVEAMPTEIEALIVNEVWIPPDEAAWIALLEEIDLNRLEGMTDGILGQAFLRVPDLETYAAVLLVRGGVAAGLGRLELALDSGSAAERAQVALALGRGGRAEYAGELERMRAPDEDPLVRGSALVGLFLMGDSAAELELRERFEPRRSFRPAGPERDPAEDAAAIDGLCSAADLAEVRALLLDIFTELEEPLGTRVAAALTASGRPDAREAVRAALRRQPPSGAEGATLVRALAVEPSLEDLELLRKLFPVENEADVNAELALALIAARDPAVMRVLETALWQEPWNRSCLAAAVLMDVAGIDALRLEALHPPLQASARDRRRIGFALGQFGGLLEVDQLGARMGSGDPALQGALLGALAARTY